MGLRLLTAWPRYSYSPLVPCYLHFRHEEMGSDSSGQLLSSVSRQCCLRHSIAICICISGDAKVSWTTVTCRDPVVCYSDSQYLLLRLSKRGSMLQLGSPEVRPAAFTVRQVCRNGCEALEPVGCEAPQVQYGSTLQRGS